jgi:uncharacterized protein with NAD-binding domain and iron-sulfur cluster
MTDGAETTKRRVVILGGGQAALTTAFQLTDPANPRHAEVDVTLYQIGWRLGGKGATGRNTDPGGHQRIEEHGFHNWFGFYDNSFRQIQSCYAELDRAPGTPLATWQDAFIPAHQVAFMENYNGRQREWILRAPPNQETPGLGKNFLPLWEYLLMMIEALHEHFAQPPPADAPTAVRAPLGARARLTIALNLARSLSCQGPAERARSHGMKRAQVFQLLHRAPRALLTLVPDARRRQGEVLLARGVAGALRRFMSALWDHVQPHLDNDDLRRGWILGNFAFGCIYGIISDDLVHRGLDAVNDQDFRPWLARNAFPDGDLMMSSPVVRSVYDSSFAYENGDTSTPPGAAYPPAAQYEVGVVLRGAIRGLFTYRGALTYRFAAGTGDSCYAPMYEVLKRRGVKFKFFHRVVELSPGSGLGQPIERITVARQVDLRAPAGALRAPAGALRAPAGAGAYDPLISVKGLPCWPHRPRFDQLARGDQLARDWVDLEDPPADFVDAGTEVLERGRDFDVVVLGISVGALSRICAPLLRQSPRWRLMTERIKTVRTQALQTWSDRTAAELGWGPRGQDTASVLWEYDRDNILNVWGDLTEIARWEGWPEGQAPRNIAYFCGPMRDDPQPAAPATAGAASARDQVRRSVVNLLSNGVAIIWKNACEEVAGHRTFRWDMLVDRRPGAVPGEARLDAQYFRANVADSERYVLSVPGSSIHRLPAHDPGTFSNLYLAGDWTQCTLNCGCMEAATISGMLCAQAITGYPERRQISGVDF